VLQCVMQRCGSRASDGADGDGRSNRRLDSTSVERARRGVFMMRCINLMASTLSANITSLAWSVRQWCKVMDADVMSMARTRGARSAARGRASMRSLN
jgi:hypothetical protein